MPLELPPDDTGEQSHESQYPRFRYPAIAARRINLEIPLSPCRPSPHAHTRRLSPRERSSISPIAVLKPRAAVSLAFCTPWGRTGSRANCRPWRAGLKERHQPFRRSFLCHIWLLFRAQGRPLPGQRRYVAHRQRRSDPDHLDTVVDPVKRHSLPPRLLRNAGRV
jgi:hypothetical protein